MFVILILQSARDRIARELKDSNERAATFSDQTVYRTRPVDIQILEARGNSQIRSKTLQLIKEYVGIGLPYLQEYYYAKGPLGKRKEIVSEMAGWGTNSSEDSRY